MTNTTGYIWAGWEAAAKRVHKAIEEVLKEKDLTKLEKKIEEREKAISKYEKKYGCWKSPIFGGACGFCGSTDHLSAMCGCKNAKNKKLKCQICGVDGHVKQGCKMVKEVAPLSITVPIEEYKHLGIEVIKTNERKVTLIEPKIMLMDKKGQRYETIDNNRAKRMQQWLSVFDVQDRELDDTSDGWTKPDRVRINYWDWKAMMMMMMMTSLLVVAN